MQARTTVIASKVKSTFLEIGLKSSALIAVLSQIIGDAFILERIYENISLVLEKLSESQSRHSQQTFPNRAKSL